MKGTRFNTSCENCKKVVEIFKIYGIKNFLDINVKHSPFLQSQVKAYTNYPSFPQLFIKGYFNGGYDEIVQRHKDDILEEDFTQANVPIKNPNIETKLVDWV